MSDWWARKLGGQPAAPAPGQPPSRNYAQPGYGVPPPAAREAYTPQPATFDPNNPIEAMAQWKGGKATKTETAACPNCGGDHFFSNANAGEGGAVSRVYTQNGVASAAPRCFDCGYTTAHGLQTGSM